MILIFLEYGVLGAYAFLLAYVLCDLGITVQSLRGLEYYTGSNGWGKSQLIKDDSIKRVEGESLQDAIARAYIEDAHARRPAYLEMAEAFTRACGPGAKLVPPSVKGQASATRKMWDRTSSSFGQPEKITDYLRCRVLIPVTKNSNNAQLNDAIDRLFDHPQTVGHKDRIWRPNAAAFRAVNAHMDQDGHIAELQIVPDDGEGYNAKINLVTESLRTSERGLRDAEAVIASGSPDARGAKMVSQAEMMIGGIREFRKALHDFAAARIGVDTMIDPALADFHRPVSGRELTTMFKDLSKNYFGRTMAIRLQQPGMGGVIPLFH